ncbi:MAG: HPr(Ser) kinase/phosphatase [Candidatus Sumerlaeota bacterium]|nr:HPr(Ser) kinase/phosphatase [Candidatus Sumerlaeota bacterium]
MAFQDPSVSQIHLADQPLRMTIRDMLKRTSDVLSLQTMAGGQGLTRPIITCNLSHPGLAFAGFFQQFEPESIQVLGVNEVAYLESLKGPRRVGAIRKVLQMDPPCLILTSGCRAPEGLVQLCEASATPLLATPMRSSQFCSELTSLLMIEFAPTVTAHGTLVNVFGLGVLISGKSGAGKSECSLELIARGHCLVADDIVIIKRVSPGTLIGRGSDVIRHHMEIHGVGIIDIMAMFGVGSVLEDSEVDLHVRLEHWDREKNYERTGLDERFTSMLGVLVPEYILPIEPGRNLSIIIEAAVLNQKMKNMGVHIAAQFNQRLIQRMIQSQPPEALSSSASLVRPEMSSQTVPGRKPAEKSAAKKKTKKKK